MSFDIADIFDGVWPYIIYIVCITVLISSFCSVVSVGKYNDAVISQWQDELEENPELESEPPELKSDTIYIVLFMVAMSILIAYVWILGAC